MALPYVIEQLKLSQNSTPITDTASVISLPSTVTKGQFSEMRLQGRSLKNELNYNRDTYAEWSVIAGTVNKDSTGIEFVFSDTTPARLDLVTNLKTNAKYGILLNIVSNTISTKNLWLNSALTGSNVNIASSGAIGNTKAVITTQATISNNKFILQQSSAGDNGLKIKVSSIRVFELPTGSEIETDFTNMTADQLAVKYPYVKGDSVKSTLSARLKAVGKNLCPTNPADWEQGAISTAGVNVVSTKRLRTKGYIRLNPLTQYKASFVAFGSSIISVRAYDINKNFIRDIGSLDGTYSFTLQSTECYVRVQLIRDDTTDMQPSEISNIKLQIEKGNVASTYETFTSTEAYTPPIGGSLPNGVKDEFNAVTGEKVQRIKEYILQSSDIASLNTTLVNVDRVQINKPSDSIGYNNTLTNWSTISGISEKVVTTADDATNIGFYSSNSITTQFVYYVAKGTYADIASARAALVGKTLNYQTMSEIKTNYPSQVLIAEPNGTIIIESFTRQTTTHEDGIKLALPLKSIEKITKINNSERTSVDLSTIKISRYSNTATAEAGTTTTNIKITAHGLAVGDRIIARNIIRRVNVVVDANNVTITAITGLTTGDSIELYKQSITDTQKIAIIGIESVYSTVEYEIIYEYPNENSTLPSLVYSFPQNLKAVVDQNTNSISSLSKSVNELNSFTIASLLNFETRLTAHGI